MQTRGWTWGIALCLGTLAGLTPGLGDSFYYPELSTFDGVAFLPAPPTPGSAEAKFDLDQVRYVGLLRSPAQCDRAWAQDPITLENYFVKTATPLLTAAETQALRPIFKKIYHDVDAVSNAVKAYYGRKRPFLLDPSLTLCAAKPTNASYPSGHSTILAAWGEVLAELCPKRAAALRWRAKEGSLDRTLAAVHFPTDVSSGMRLGSELAHVMFSAPSFATDLAALRAIALPSCH